MTNFPWRLKSVMPARFVILTLVFLFVACGSQSAPTPTLSPTTTPVPIGGATGNYVLVYEPDTGTNIEVNFGAAVSDKDVIQAIEELGITDVDVRSQDTNSVGIRTALLSNARQQELRAILAQQVGPIDNFQVTEIPTPTSDQMDGAILIIDRRLTLLGIEKPFVQLSSGNRVSVQIPRAEVTVSIDGVKALIEQTARLEFKERTCDGGVDQATGICLSPRDADIGLTGDDLSRAGASTDALDVGWVINLEFNGRGTSIFSDLTQRIVGNDAKRIAIFLDDVELIALVSRAWIRDGRTQISGNFTKEEARLLAIQLESGRLPVPLRSIEETIPVQR